MCKTISNVTILSLALLLTTPHLGCRNQPASGAAQAQQAAAVSFASALAALEVLDTLHAQRMAANVDPTPEQYAQAEAYSAKLHRLRDALAIVRMWLTGDATQEQGRSAFRDSAALLQLLVDELRAQGARVPPAVDAGLAAAQLFR